MLDLSHPQSQHIFAAGRLEDSILGGAKSIIAARAAERLDLLTQCARALDAMRILNSEHFDGSQFIFESIDELQRALQRLADTDEPRLDIIMPALSRLRSADGFCTEFI